MSLFANVWMYVYMVCLVQLLNSSQDYVFECFEPGMVPRPLINVPKHRLLTDCASAAKISLLRPEVFTPYGLKQDELDTLFKVPHLDMCIKIYETKYDHLNMLMKELTGRCEGPVLDIRGNYQLTKLKVGEFVKKMKPNSIRIRGNRKLMKSQLTAFDGFSDIQEDGECLMPVPLKAPLELYNCDRVYGVMTVPTSKHFSEDFQNYTYTGCIHITSDELTNVDFLEHFKRFTHIPGCSQYIADSPNLCVKNRSWLRSTFGEDLEIYNNKPDCDSQCPGGEVTEDYLKDTATCETRIGDVVIKDWKGKPKNADVLYKTKYIEGRLIIAHNDGFANFDYFKNLEVVGTPIIAGIQPVLLVENNTNLKSVEMPKLSRVSQKGEGVLIRVRDNTGLVLSKAQTDIFKTAAGGSTHVDLVIHTFTAKKDKSDNVDLANSVDPSKTAHSSNTRDWWFLLILPLIVLSLLVLFLVSMILFTEMRLKTYDKRLDRLVGLSRKSQAILADLCKEIVEKNPFVWMIQSRPLIWRYSQKDSKRSEIDELKGKHATFLQSHALKIFPNAHISLTNERCVIDRVCNIIKHEAVLIIGTEDDISLVIPSLPNAIGSTHTYNANNSSITFKLQDVRYTDIETRLFTYTVAVSQDGRLSKKKLRAFFYIWDPLRLPVSFHELGRLVFLCSKKKMPCISNRRKEVFSLMYMVFTYVFVLQQSIGVVEAFQLHTDNVNGAPLDCCEMLCVMAFIMEWAYQTYSVPKEIEQKHNDWCHTYARISNFYSDHPNIMTVHPEKLVTSRMALLREEIGHAGACSGDSFSDRPRNVTSDKFRRRTSIELKSLSKEKPRIDQVNSDDDTTTMNNTSTTLQ